MSKFLLAHDLGTSGNKATLYDTDGNFRGSAVYGYPTYYPANLFVEQEPEDWWTAVCKATRELISSTGIIPSDIAAVSFSGHMMGCVPVDGSGRAVGRSIIWADMRGGKQAKMVEDRLTMERFYKITGHRISPSYSLAKLLWIKENEPERYKMAYKMLNAKDYVILKLTGRPATEYSDAGGTNLLDMEKKAWSREIAEAAGIDPDILPEVTASTDIAGKVTRGAAEATGLCEGTPVVFGGGDGCCAAVGAGAVNEGDIYNVIGSSSWIAGASKEPYYDPGFRTFTWVHLDKELYSPCGSMQAAGYSYSWAKNILCAAETQEAAQKGISPYKLIDRLVSEASPGAGGLIFLPYLLGERSPRWNSDATGAFIGARVTTHRGDILRSVLEGVGYNLKVILDLINSKFNSERITVIGGGAKGEVWLQILADIWQKEVLVPRYLEEATSLGAAVCAGVGVGAFEDFNVIRLFNPIEKVIKPDPAKRGLYEKMYLAFNNAYNALAPVYKELSAV